MTTARAGTRTTTPPAARRVPTGTAPARTAAHVRHAARHRRAVADVSARAAPGTPRAGREWTIRRLTTAWLAACGPACEARSGARIRCACHSCTRARGTRHGGHGGRSARPPRRGVGRRASSAAPLQRDPAPTARSRPSCTCRCGTPPGRHAGARCNPFRPRMTSRARSSSRRPPRPAPTSGGDRRHSGGPPPSRSCIRRSSTVARWSRASTWAAAGAAEARTMDRSPSNSYLGHRRRTPRTHAEARSSSSRAPHCPPPPPAALCSPRTRRPRRQPSRPRSSTISFSSRAYPPSVAAPSRGSRA